MNNKSLKTYRDLRNFTTSPEPKGGRTKKSGEPLFVIHKHDARSLHYDLRLEEDGVLKSWAIPKGPSDNPHDKRLAIQTEDHPLEYANFEGVIPEGNYGAGGVMIWDKGTFKNLKSESLSTCIEHGIVEVELHGEKMRGRYALIHTHFAPHSWLLIKMKEGTPSYDHILEQDRSIVSNKTMEEIEGDQSPAHSVHRSSPVIPRPLCRRDCIEGRGSHEDTQSSANKKSSKIKKKSRT
jgi:DNA ligase D-like protein (predicted 3'-phosphoesterase)